MATGNIKGGKRNYAKVTTPSTSSITASTSQVGIDYSFTASTLGPAATSYVFYGTSNDGGTAVTSTVTATSGTVTGYTGGKTYTVYMAGQNYNGQGPGTTPVTSIVIPTQYTEAGTFNSSSTYTVATGKTKLAGIVVSAGGSGGTANHGGAGGGGSGAVVGFWEFPVTAGTTVTVTVGASGSATKVTYDGTDIATANSGATGSVGSDNNGGAGGAGGTASSNISTNRTLVNGNAGGAGGAKGAGVPNVGEPGGNGTPNTETISFTSGSISFAPNTNTAIYLGSGGGGGGGGQSSFNGGTREGGAAGAGGNPTGRGGAGGAGGTAYFNNNQVNSQYGGNGTSTNAIGSGGGGAGGGGVNNDYGGRTGGSAGTGGPGRIILYVRD